MNDGNIKQLANRIYQRTLGHTTALYLSPEMIEKVIYLYLEFIQSTGSEPYRNVNPLEPKNPLTDKYIKYVYLKLYGTDIDYKKRDSVWVAISFIMQCANENAIYKSIWQGTYRPTGGNVQPIPVQPVTPIGPVSPDFDTDGIIDNSIIPTDKTDVSMYLTIVGVILGAIGIAMMSKDKKKRR